MRFTPTALRFAPVLPAAWGAASLQGVRYRGMTLNIALTGAGNEIASFRLDGQVMTAAQVPGTLTGTHQIDISLTNALSNVAREAVATSSPTAADYPGPAGVNDGKINGYLDDVTPSPDFRAGSPASGPVVNLGDEKRSEWVSAPESKASAWVQLDWTTTQSVQMVRLFDRINATDHITGGTLTFSDGSTIVVPSLPNDGLSAFEARFPSKMIRWARFTITAISDSTVEPETGGARSARLAPRWRARHGWWALHDGRRARECKLADRGGRKRRRGARRGYGRTGRCSRGRGRKGLRWRRRRERRRSDRRSRHEAERLKRGFEWLRVPHTWPAVAPRARRPRAARRRSDHGLEETAPMSSGAARLWPLADARLVSARAREEISARGWPPHYP